jgi:hypothetical protein
MNKLLATLVAGTFAVAASSAFAQGTTPPTTPPATPPSTMEKAKDNLQKAQSSDKAKAFAEKEKSAQDLSRNSPNPADQKANVEKSKMDPRTKAKYDEKAAQSLSSNSATDPAQAKANVDASKMQSAKREKMPNLKNLTKEQKQELYRQLQKENTGG